MASVYITIPEDDGGGTAPIVEVKGTNGNIIEPNPDGSLNVNVVSVPAAGNTVRNIYSEANAVPSGLTATIVTYTVSGSLTESVLERISVSGDNIAMFTVFVNATQIDTRRTYFGGSLNEYFEFTTGTSNGYVLTPGDVLTVNVIHNRPTLGNFEGRIQVLEIT